MSPRSGKFALRRVNRLRLPMPQGGLKRPRVLDRMSSVCPGSLSVWDSDFPSHPISLSSLQAEMLPFSDDKSACLSLPSSNRKARRSCRPAVRPQATGGVEPNVKALLHGFGHLAAARVGFMTCARSTVDPLPLPLDPLAPLGRVSAAAEKVAQEGSTPLKCEHLFARGKHALTEQPQPGRLESLRWNHSLANLQRQQNLIGVAASRQGVDGFPTSSFFDSLCLGSCDSFSRDSFSLCSFGRKHGRGAKPMLARPIVVNRVRQAS